MRLLSWLGLPAELASGASPAQRHFGAIAQEIVNLAEIRAPVPQQISGIAPPVAKK